jgi:hypothetical protein
MDQISCPLVVASVFLLYFSIFICEIIEANINFWLSFHIRKFNNNALLLAKIILEKTFLFLENIGMMEL